MSHSTAPQVPGCRCGQTCEFRSCIRDSQPLRSRHCANRTFVPAPVRPEDRRRHIRRVTIATVTICRRRGTALLEQQRALCGKHPFGRIHGHWRLLSFDPNRDHRWDRTLLAQGGKFKLETEAAVHARVTPHWRGVHIRGRGRSCSKLLQVKTIRGSRRTRRSAEM